MLENPTPRRVLLVDDNEEWVELLRLALARTGDQVHVAQNASDALEVARAFAPDVIVVDIGLPGADGYELAALLRQIPGVARSKFIAMTAYDNAEYLERSAAAGFSAHLVKPFPLRTLLEEVAR